MGSLKLHRLQIKSSDGVKPHGWLVDGTGLKLIRPNSGARWLLRGDDAITREWIADFDLVDVQFDTRAELLRTVTACAVIRPIPPRQRNGVNLIRTSASQYHSADGEWVISRDEERSGWKLAYADTPTLSLWYPSLPVIRDELARFDGLRAL